MTYSNIFKKSALALAAVGLFASASAQADSLVIEQDINSLAFTVNVSGTQDDVVAGVFNVDNLTTGTSFLAFCFELLQGVNVNALTPPGLVFTAGSTANADLQTLFNQSYSSLDFNDASQLAGFQIALWETLDDKSLTSGTYRNWAGDTGSIEEDLALIVAETFLDNITLGAPGTGNYKLTTWLNGNSQDLIQATPGTTVPEPTSMLLGALGLAGMAAVRRRKA
ncbi:PEP-CTERM sorting domain-containing protein [Zoogloea sp.]|uniref:PEP-CTERM sorting domain-containing protein n=1 Tax=Zoogloea sp. TaxID=49181 RepID=UPI001ACE111B|nr:PEP-CTERM sorting domain-containing protein [Zoogloea sp.]MBN8284334.1 PEP-CTERM sorting domain-containing protein [Zoogloea sp.]